MMNKRIQQLAMQAGYVPIPYAEFANSLNELFNEKFAELIIRECMQIADQPLSADGKYDDFLPSQMIADHFGVKE